MYAMKLSGIVTPIEIVESELEEGIYIHSHSTETLLDSAIVLVVAPDGELYLAIKYYEPVGECTHFFSALNPHKRN